MELTSANVHKVFTFCLFREEEITGNEMPLEAVVAHGLTINVGLHPGRLQESFEDIKSMLSCLDSDFMKETVTNEGKGGQSFLASVYDKNKVQWGEQANAQELLILGLASNLAKYCADRSIWSSLPGGVPYFVVDLSGAWTDFETVGAEKFDVWQFFADGSQEKVLSQGTADEAVNTARRFSTSVGAKIGTTKSVTIVDSLDFTVYEWQYGKGIVFPPTPEEQSQENFS